MTTSQIAKSLVKTIRKFEDQGMFGYDAEDAAIAELVAQGFDEADLVNSLRQMDEIAQDECDLDAEVVTIKSITTVRATGAGNNGNWVIRARLSAGVPVYAGIGSGYNLAQAQSLASNSHECVGSEIRDASLWQVRPAGVSISAK